MAFVAGVITRADLGEKDCVGGELVRRGLAVDVGVVEVVERKDGRRTKTLREIDFVVNDGPRRVYIQSAWAIPDEEKRRTETLSLRKTGDLLHRIVVTGDPFEKTWTDKSGRRMRRHPLCPFRRNHPRGIAHETKS